MTLPAIALAIFAFLLPNLANGQGSSDVIYVQVGVERSKVCGGRAYAESAARLELVNKASKMCGQVTPGRWVLNRKGMDKEDHGLMVCDRCKNDPGQYSCSILGSHFPCVNLEKKKPEKPKDAEADSAKAKEQAGKDGKDGSGQKKDSADGRPADPNQKPEPKKDEKPGPNQGGNTKPQDQPNKGAASADQNKDPGKGSPNDKYKAACERVNDTGGTGQGSRPGDSVCGPSKGSGGSPPPNAVSRNIWDDLDESAAGSQIKAIHAELVQEFRWKARDECSGEWSRIRACYKSLGCQVPSKTETEQCEKAKCGSEPSKTTCYRPIALLTVIRTSKSGDTSPPELQNRRSTETEPECKETPNPRYPQWQQCISSASECRIDRICLQTCNVNADADESACLDRKMLRAPTEDVARAALRQNWKQKESQPRKAAAPRNFLD